jgi:hypothetical protein
MAFMIVLSCEKALLAVTRQQPRPALNNLVENKLRRAGMVASILTVLLVSACSGQTDPTSTIPPVSTSSMALSGAVAGGSVL